MTLPNMKSFGVRLVGGTVAGMVALGLVLLFVVGVITAVPIQHDFFTVSFSVIGDSGAIRTTGIAFCNQIKRVDALVELAKHIFVYAIIYTLNNHYSNKAIADSGLYLLL